MQVKHLDHLNMSVANIDESVSWYKRILGFEIVESGWYDSQPWAIIRSGDAMLCLYERPGARLQSKAERIRSNQLGISHFALRITDVDAWEKTVQSEKVPLHYGGKTTWPHSSAWYITDPNGYEIEVAAWADDKVAFKSDQRLEDGNERLEESSLQDVKEPLGVFEAHSLVK